jgi:hypothetical protein
MSSSKLNANISVSSAAAATAAMLALAGLAAPASAIVVEGMVSMDRPTGAAVGNWNGSSGVPVGPQWFITAKHCGGAVNGWFLCNGNWHMAVEIREHPTMDLQMVRVAETFENWHRVAEGVVAGDPCIMGGWGVTAGAPIDGNLGYTWGGPHGETWGANVVQAASAVMSVRFDAPSSPNAVPYEASFAVNDSGGGLFTWGVDGQLELAAIAVSISGYGAAAYGQNGYAIRLEPLKTWIMEVADPAMPIASSVVAPRASIIGPGMIGVAAGAGLLAGLYGLRRRRGAM